MKDIAEKQNGVQIIIKAATRIQTGFALTLYVLLLAGFFSSAAAQDIEPEPKTALTETFSAGCYARVNDSQVRLRDRPGLTGNKITLLDKNETVTVLQRSGNKEKIDSMDAYWYQVSTLKEITGWVYGFFLDFPDQKKKGTGTTTFVREFLLDTGRYALLVKNDAGFCLLPNAYEAIKDPYVITDDSFKLHSDFCSKEPGFRIYKNHRYNTRYLAACKNGVWGFVDIQAEGDFIISPEFEDAHPFKEGFAAVKVNGKWGFINEKGIMVIQPRYSQVNDFFSGMCIVEYSEKGKSMTAAIDTTGKLRFAFEKDKKFSIIYDFYEPGIALAIDTDYREYAIDPDGNIVLQGLAELGERGGPLDPCFSFGEKTKLCVMACIDKEIYNETGNTSEATRFGAFDKKGRWILKPVYKSADEVFERISSFYPDGSCILLSDSATGKYGFKSNKNIWIIKAVYDYAYSFLDDAAVVIRNKKYGLIDKSGMWIVKPEFDNLWENGTGAYQAEKDGKYGIIDKTGKPLIPVAYDCIGTYTRQYPVYAEADGKKGFINTDGKWILETTSKDNFVEFKEGIAFQYTEVKYKYSNNFSHKCRVRPIDSSGTCLFQNYQFYEIYQESEF